MTDTPTNVSADASIAEKQQRLETIIDKLEDGAVSLKRAKELHEEGTALIEALEEELALGDGEVIERT
ncbi:exodeoxyribonuclease VII small subunit [Halocatena salina]|uniref:Exodeoxyribonuclease VII small subunit n=1 Tax=Halocatena salina TaxID=2934340 RepID=A0A8U0A815_9EURY|nr:exodeoxyribonuclease VII small subunit [Halocatena salina]UPM45275.1 exodeoxyribonuclease VII small subunit [Halocatena salina]